MNNVVKALYCLVFSFVSVTALAQEEPQWWNGFYVGGSYGMSRLSTGAHMNVAPPNEDTACVDPNNGGSVVGVIACPVDYYAETIKPSSLELFTGWRFMEALGGDIGAELRLSTAIPETVFTFVDMSATAVGLYGTYQTQGPVYLKGLIGFAQTTFDMNGGEYASLNQSASGASVGFAVGQKIFGGAIELMYMIYPSIDLDDSQRQYGFSYNLEGGSCPTSTSTSCSPATITLNDKIKYETLTVGYVYTF